MSKRSLVMGDRRPRGRETLSRGKGSRGFQVWVWPLAFVLRHEIFIATVRVSM